MTEMRSLGLMIKKYAELAKTNQSSIAEILGCTEEQVIDLYSGRFLLSLEQFRKLSEKLEVELELFLQPDEQYYKDNVVHCMRNFTSDNNREKILDFIDVYINTCNAIEIGKSCVIKLSE